MLYLPFPAERGPTLAVSDASVAAIERCLLVGDRQFGLNLLADAIVADPWLTLWVHRDGGADATTAFSLADQAIDHLLEWLKLSEAASATDPLDNAWTRPDDSLAIELTRAATRSLAAARRAHSGSHDRDALVNSAAYLAELLRVSENGSGSDAACEILGQRYQKRDDAAVWRLPRLVARLADPPAHSTAFESIVRQQKLDAMKELAYGASHEINNPLANISGRAQALLKDETEPSRRKLLQAINTQSLRAHDMISDLMLFARPPKLVKECVGMNELLSRVIEEMRPELSHRQIRLDWTPAGESLAAKVDSQQIGVAIKALLQNSIDSLVAGGRIEVDLRMECNGNERWIELGVCDTGPGIPTEIRQHLFDPFYSGREAGRGLGFGLSKCWRIVTDHGGSIQLEESSSCGTTFTLRLPAGLADSLS